MDSKEKIIKILKEKGNEILNKPPENIEFTKNEEADKLLNNLKDFPHAFVLACIMDRQIKAERAWLIPYEVSKEIKGFKISQLRTISPEEIIEIFEKKSLHRFNKIMGENFYLAIQKIHNDYLDDASNIWRNNLGSATLMKRFLSFKGVGIKIASMATNILAREFKILMKDYININISPDIQVKRVFRRLGLISKNSSNEELIYCARELNPEYPGIFDLPCWEIGRNWCRPNKPICEKCYLSRYCNKNI